MLNTFGLLSSLYVTLFGAIFLFAASGKDYKNRLYLSIFFIDGFVLFLGHVFSFYEYWRAFRYFDFAFLASLLLFYPLYFRYLNIAFGYKLSFLKWRYQYAPAILFGVSMLFASYTADWDSYSSYMNNNVYGTPVTDIHATVLNILYKGARYVHIIQILIYNVLSIAYIIRTRKNIRNSFSNEDRFQLQYFYLVNVVFLVFMAIPGIYVTIVGRTQFVADSYLLGAVSFVFTFLYVILGIVGLRQKPFTQEEIKQNEELEDLTIPADKDYSQIKSKLLSLFEDELIWKDPQLNIWDVSKALGTNRTYVSNIINREFKCNFNVFVNNYRVDEVKLLLNDPENKRFSMEEIADMSGFGSLSSLIRSFRSITGMTPHKFRSKL